MALTLMSLLCLYKLYAHSTAFVFIKKLNDAPYWHSIMFCSFSRRRRRSIVVWKLTRFFYVCDIKVKLKYRHFRWFFFVMSIAWNFRVKFLDFRLSLISRRVAATLFDRCHNNFARKVSVLLIFISQYFINNWWRLTVGTW